MPLKDRHGEVHGFWTVLEYAGSEKWTCRCKCGTIRNVSASSLWRNVSKSCGCFKSPLEECYIEKTKKRILSKVKFDENGCWTWTGTCGPSGYGHMSYRSTFCKKVHRMAWILWMGEVPDGLYVLHHCDNRKCCNPEHLFLGTHKDNMQDMKEKGRACKGEKSHLHHTNRRKK
jgi:hypothetical protein